MSLNKTEQELERAKVLLKAMCEICDKLDRSHFVLNFFEQTAEYDGLEYDGYRLLEDSKEFLDNSKTVTQEDFNKEFNKILEESTQRYIDTDGELCREITSHIEVFDKDKQWLIDYSTDPKYPYFWYSEKLYKSLISKLNLEDGEFSFLIENLVKTQFEIKNAKIDKGAT